MAGIPCGKLDISKLSDDELISIDSKAWLKADVDEKIYIWRNEPNVVIKFSDSCTQTVCPDFDNIIRSLLFTATGLKKGDTDSGTNVDKDNSREYQPNTVCGADAEWLKNAQNGIDAHGINNMGYQPAVVMPSAAIIPLKSNVKMYGPYASSNFGNSAGGTQVIVDADICPWVFGSIADMNNAGLSIVESSAIGLTRAESGSVTIVGLPDLASLGTAVASGPNLTNINFTYGSGGVTTSYEFKTYTPKFGSLNRHFIDKFKDIARNRQEQLKFLRNNQIVQNKIDRKIERSKRRAAKENKLPAKQPSLQRVIVGEIYDWDSNGNYNAQRTIVGSDTLSKSVTEMIFEYDKKAYMSWDGLFGPVSLKGSGGLPRYAAFEPKGHKSSPISPQPPFSVSGDCSNKELIHEQYNLEITQNYINPLTNSFTADQHHHQGGGAGHVIDIVGRKNEVPQSGVITNFYRPDDNDRYADDYRFIGMRGPIVLHSWGYDLDGKPVPNAADSEEATKQGTFKSDYLKDEFLQDWLKKPATWPAAPIDLRFDRDRGLWVSPQAYKIVVAKIIETVDCYGEGKGVIVPYGKELFDKDGAKVKPKFGKEDACGPGISDKKYEWVLVNIGPCDQNIKWYCVSNPNYVNVGDPTSVCMSTDDPAFPGVRSAFSGPYDNPTDCPCAQTTPTPTPTPSLNLVSTPTPTPSPSPISSTTTTVITGVTLGEGGLVFTTAVIQILGILDTGSITIATTNCESSPPEVSPSPTPTPTTSPTPTSTYTPTPTPTLTLTPTESPTPTTTSTTTPTPTQTQTPSPSPSPTSDVEYDATIMINIVDRLGKTHQIGELVYAYFDTTTEKYIVLQKHPETITPTIYGIYDPIDNTEGILIVEYATGTEYCDDGVMKNSQITVLNKLNLVTDCSAPAVAIRMEKLT